VIVERPGVKVNALLLTSTGSGSLQVLRGKKIRTLFDTELQNLPIASPQKKISRVTSGPGVVLNEKADSKRARKKKTCKRVFGKGRNHNNNLG